VLVSTPASVLEAVELVGERVVLQPATAASASAPPVRRSPRRDGARAPSLVAASSSWEGIAP
jgi:hypothetical protein